MQLDVTFPDPDADTRPSMWLEAPSVKILNLPVSPSKSLLDQFSVTDLRDAELSWETQQVNQITDSVDPTPEVSQQMGLAIRNRWERPAAVNNLTQ